MSEEKFVVGDWTGRLARALTKLAEAQAPYLRECGWKTLGLHVTYDGQDCESQAFLLDELRMLYSMARQSHAFGQVEYYAPLCAALNPVRYILISHPTLERVVGRLIGRDEFHMQILNSGGSTSPTDLIAGLFARAEEFKNDGLQAAAEELNAFLAPAGETSTVNMPGDLNVGYDVLLFWGLTLKERIDAKDGMVLLPFKEISAFVDENQVDEYAPPFAGFHRWQSVGAIVRPYRWKPEFYRPGPPLRDREPNNPWSFFREAQSFLELLAIAHARPVLYLASLPNCIYRSAGRLLGQSNHQGSFYQRGRSVQEFDGLDLCKVLDKEAYAEAKVAFDNRESERHRRMAPIISRLANALARDGRFAGADRILDVAIVLECMYELDSRNISSKLQDRASRYLGGDAKSQQLVKENIKEFYEVRSAIIHGRLDRMTPQKISMAFDKGFNIARRSLFKLLHDGPPDNWNALVVGDVEGGRASIS